MTESTAVVATEVAEDEFNRFLEAMDLEFKQDSMNADERSSLADAKRKLVGEIERGRLVIDDKGQPVYTPQDGAPITFYEPTGASFMSMDSKAKDASFGKLVAFMAEMTKTPPTRFAKLPGRDFKVCQTIVTLFLA